MPIVLKPNFVYENLRTCVLKNRAKMTPQHIKLTKDPNNYTITVHDKITIEVVQGDVVFDENTDIKCGTIDWGLNASYGVTKAFSRFGGERIQQTLSLYM